MPGKTAQAIILAAGESSRFKTGRTKLLEKLCGQEMILYPTTALEQLNLQTTLVTGYQADEIKKTVTQRHKNVSFAVQEKRLGTGHALAQSKHLWEKDTILVLNGDAPLVDKAIIEKLIKKHTETNAAITFATAHHSNPSDGKYGRVITENGKLQIIEAKDYVRNGADDCCVNVGIYVFDKTFLNEHIEKLSNANNAQEYYITDFVKMATDKNLAVETVDVPFDHARGINTLQELWAAEQIKRSEIIRYWMHNGVRFHAAQSAIIETNVSIGKGTSVGAGVHLLKNTTVGENVTIESFSILDNATIEDHVTIHAHSIVNNSHIKKHSSVGPFANIQEKTTIEQKAIIGNFVEIKRSTIGAETKAKHLSYIGDAHVGRNVNIGAGTIFCNHSGRSKNTTTINDNSYIGSNSTLIAPLSIGSSAFTAGGSVITKDVPDDALAIGRSRQVNKDGYAHRLLKHDTHEQAHPKTEKPSESFMGARKFNDDSAG